MNNLITDIHNQFKTRRQLQHFIPVMSSYIGSDYLSYINENDTNYTRTIVTMPDYITDFELIVITWMPGQSTRIHDHSSNGCVLRVLEGCLQETVYNHNLVLKTKTVLKTGTIGYIDNSIGYHEIKNTSNKRAVSLHLYSPPKHNTKIFNY